MLVVRVTDNIVEIGRDRLDDKESKYLSTANNVGYGDNDTEGERPADRDAVKDMVGEAAIDSVAVAFVVFVNESLRVNDCVIDTEQSQIGNDSFGKTARYKLLFCLILYDRITEREGADVTQRLLKSRVGG